MTLYDRFIVRRLAVTFVRSLLALAGLYVAVDLVTHRSGTIMSKGVPWSVVAEYYAVSTPVVLYEQPLAALAVLVTGLAVLGGAAQRNELTALLASGVSLRRIAAWPVACGVAVTAMVFVFSQTLGVAAAARSQEIEELYLVTSGAVPRHGVSWTNLPGDWDCHVMKFNRRALSGEDVLMLGTTGGESQQIRAKRIYWNPSRLEWIIEDGIWSTFNSKEGMSGVHRRIRQETAPLRETPDRLFAFEDDGAAKSAGDLAATIGIARDWGIPTTRLEVAYQTRFAKPVLCAVMMLLALPFALRVRRGGVAIGLGVSIAVGLAYLLVFSLAEGLGSMGRIPVAAGAWSANIVFALVGLELLRRTPT
ncbi:MAG: LptF/LptG family permease [Candidatus Hydrogenedentota bacterium]